MSAVKHITSLQSNQTKYFTFFCRLHIGGERGEKVQSPLLTGCSEAELGTDARAKGILHSTSDAQLSRDWNGTVLGAR